MSKPIYVPILKGREGEYSALEALEPDVRARLLPLIEIPSVPFDFPNEAPAKTLDAHVSPIPDRLKRCWGNARPLLLDMPWFGDGERLADGSMALGRVLEGCSLLGLAVVPVVAKSSSAGYLEAAGAHAGRYGTGICLRLEEQDFADDVNIDTEIGAMLTALGGLRPEAVDVLIDLDDLEQNAGRVNLVARYVLSSLPELPWRNVILAGASFPEDLSDVDARSVATLPRLEWSLWTGLKTWASRHRPGLVYGDYAIANPRIRELDPRLMRMSASIRYTVPDAWLVLKGRNVRQHGFEQYFDLCQALVAQPAYCGPDFSWGDFYIAECAARRTGPGNATTWRKVGTNHHLTLVTQTLANQADGS
jgi:hypothetical protein